MKKQFTIETNNIKIVGKAKNLIDFLEELIKPVQEVKLQNN